MKINQINSLNNKIYNNVFSKKQNNLIFSQNNIELKGLETLGVYNNIS